MVPQGNFCIPLNACTADPWGIHKQVEDVYPERVFATVYVRSLGSSAAQHGVTNWCQPRGRDPPHSGKPWRKHAMLMYRVM